MPSYSQVTFDYLQEELKLTVIQQAFLPDEVPNVELPAWLLGYLRVNQAAPAVTKSEKAMSEMVIAPVLSVVKEANADKIALFSGEPLYHEDLGGVCDFILAANPKSFTPEPPIMVLVEAKKQDILGGIPQCIAEMRTAQHLNVRKGRPDLVYGCVTTGTAWQFIRLEGTTAEVDPQALFNSNLKRVVGTLQWIVDQFV
ncbi:MAG: hypothetical protein ACRYFX_16355 [Janthinobacterium lividum]